MSSPLGKSLAVPLGRKTVTDFLYASMGIPIVTIEKEINIAELVEARRIANPRPSWCAIFTKAYAKVVASRPDLRRAYLTFPWERLFEYAETTADVVLETTLGTETILTHARLKRPAEMPLLDLDCEVTGCKADPLKHQKRLRRARLLARFPRLIRRWAWWYLLNVSARERAKQLGTFGVSSVANWGTEALRPLAPWISLLHYGRIDADGKVALRLTFDHRVLDGSGSSAALNEMERILKLDLLGELKSLQNPMLKAG